VIASTILRKLTAYRRQNRLSIFLRDIELRRRIQADLNKSEARNALTRAVFSSVSNLNGPLLSVQYRTNRQVTPLYTSQRCTN
jgi:hypothetical protein